MNNFTQLHFSSSSSIREGLCSPKEIVLNAKENNLKSVAITDQHSMFSTIAAYREAKDKDIKLIIGSEINVLEKFEYNDKKELIDNKSFTLLFIAKNNEGYINLMEIVTEGYVNGLCEKSSKSRNEIPYVSLDYLKEKLKNNNNLFILSNSIYGDVGQFILEDKFDEARDRIKTWKNLIGDNYFTEITRTGKFKEDKFLPIAVDMSIQENIPIVATNNIKFMNKEDFKTHETKISIIESQKLVERGFNTQFSPHQYFKTESEMRELFKDIPEAIDNISFITQSCNLELTLDNPVLPKFKIPNGESEGEYLKRISFEGLNKLFPKILKNFSLDKIEEEKRKYINRMEVELNVINSMGFPGYFLIVSDFMKWARKNDVPVGPGRGSGAGSLVAYSCGITDIDPLKYDLLFERFLNPERVSMPDFDIDLGKEKRDTVADYIKDKYGEESFCKISTLGLMKARAVVKASARAKGYPYAIGDKITKLMPNRVDVSLEDAFKESELLRKEYEDNDEVKDIIDTAKKLENIPNQIGTHAAGVVISPTKITDYSAIYMKDGTTSTQYDKNDIEASGLVKFDLLGLKNLDIIHESLKNIQETQKINLDITDIPLDDEKTFKLLKEANTTSVFQLESHGMKGVIKKLQPDNFNDIVALVALYRPGPLQSGMVDDYIDVKHGLKEANYPHPMLEEILKPTYGVIVYQEQVMQIAQVLSNYTLGEADLLRRAMGKKKPAEMAKQKDKFVSGAVKNGVDEELAEYIFMLVDKFSGYGFNKSHSVAYAMIAYQTAYLKANYPSEFMASSLSYVHDDLIKIKKYIIDANKMNVEIISPDVNRSNSKFKAIDKKTSIFGLKTIKSIGDKIVSQIIEERDKNGKFIDIYDFLRRVKSLSKTHIVSLAKSGALDTFGHSRQSIIDSIDKITEFKKIIKDKNEGKLREELNNINKKIENGSLPIDYKIPSRYEIFSWCDTDFIKQTSTVSKKNTLNDEIFSIGYNLSDNLLNFYKNEFDGLRTVYNKDIDPEQHEFKNSEQNLFIQVGIVNDLNVNKNRVVFSIDDGTDVIECQSFGKKGKELSNKIINNEIILVKGKLKFNQYREDYVINIDDIQTLQEIREKNCTQTVIDLNNRVDDETINFVKNLSEKYSPGYSKLSVVNNNTKIDGFPLSIIPSDLLITELNEKNISIKLNYEKEIFFNEDNIIENKSINNKDSKEINKEIENEFKNVLKLLNEAGEEKQDQVRKGIIPRYNMNM